jgi:hypothetical protein
MPLTRAETITNRWRIRRLEIEKNTQKESAEGAGKAEAGTYTAHRLNLQRNPTADRQPSAFPETPL